jgi:hypothetical protein
MTETQARRNHTMKPVTHSNQRAGGETLTDTLAHAVYGEPLSQLGADTANLITVTTAEFLHRLNRTDSTSEAPPVLTGGRLVCHWYEPSGDPGARMLIPGCMARVDDPDRCDCPPPAPAPEVIHLHLRLAASYAAHRELRSELSALARAVAEHPDNRKIFTRSDQIRKGEHR